MAQLQKGDSLASQETRCRDYANQGYTISKVFKDEEASGGLFDRFLCPSADSLWYQLPALLKAMAIQENGFIAGRLYSDELIKEGIALA